MAIISRGSTAKTSSPADPALKVLLLVTDLSYGGTPRAVQQLALGLVSRGHEVRVASLLSGGGVAEELVSAGIPVVALDADRRGIARAALSFFKLLRRERVDVLHAFLFHSNLIGRVVGRLAGVPAVIVSERSVESGKTSWRLWADRLTWRLADCWTANSREVARVLEQRERIVASRITVIPNGVDVAHFSQQVNPTAFRTQCDLMSGDRVVVCVGRLDKLKGQATLLEALRIVADEEPTSRLCFVGEGALRQALERQAAELRLMGRVCFAGSLADVRPALAVADLVVLPSTDEGLPGIVLEAFAAGVPVVATAVGGTPELVEHEHTGLLVAARDPAAMAAAIVRLMRDAGLRHRLSQSAREFVQHLSVDRMVGTTEHLYQRLCPERPAGASTAAA